VRIIKVANEGTRKATSTRNAVGKIRMTLVTVCFRTDGNELQVIRKMLAAGASDFKMTRCSSAVLPRPFYECGLR
jgi:hypothetical protein